jgi:hypothetical protein
MDLVEQLLRFPRMLAQRDVAKEDRLPLRGGLDHVAILLEHPQTQQTVMVRRLLVRWNGQPSVVRVEGS